MTSLHELSPADETRLQDFFATEAGEGSLDYMGAHGFITATCISPVAIPESEWIPELLGQDAIPEGVAELLSRWRKAIHSSLYHDEVLEMPCELAPEDEDLEAWCAGFMEGLFLREDDWYAIDEETVAELTMSILVFSGLVDDQEMMNLRRNRKIAAEMAKRIPDILSELYLLFHAPKEAPPVRSGKPPIQRKR